MEIIKEARFLDDRASLDAIVAQMGDTERLPYLGYGARSLEAGFPNRRLVVYRLEAGAPVDTDVLMLGYMEMTKFDGPIITVADAKGEVVVGLQPVRWRNRDLFLHIPQTFEFKWKGKESGRGKLQFAPHYAILIKTKSRENLQVDGDTYCVTLNKFRERFPEVPIRY